MEESDSFIVRAVYRNEWDTAMEIAWRTFLKFEAPDYPQEGIRSFYDFVKDETLHRMFLAGNYQMFGAFIGKQMIGMISMRGEGHISLLFVDKRYHRRGVGRALIQHLETYLLSEMGIGKMTVNASPYGEAFYQKLGFQDIGPKTQQDGIIYTPMELIL